MAAMGPYPESLIAAMTARACRAELAPLGPSPQTERSAAEQAPLYKGSGETVASTGVEDPQAACTIGMAFGLRHWASSCASCARAACRWRSLMWP